MSSIKFEKFQLYFLLHIFVFLYLLHWLSGTLFMYVIPFDIISCFPESWVLLLLFSSISFFSNLQVGRISVDLFSRLPTYHSLMSLSISKYFFFKIYLSFKILLYPGHCESYIIETMGPIVILWKKKNWYDLNNKIWYISVSGNSNYSSVRWACLCKCLLGLAQGFIVHWLVWEFFV